MGRRTWAITVVCGLVTVACGITAVVAAQHRANAEDRQAAAEQQLSNTTDLAALRTELDAQHDTQTELDTRAETLSAMFTPDAVNAVAQVQADALPGACALARTATRNATPPPNAESYAAYAIAATTNPALDGLPDRWGRMIDPTQIQAEINRCTTDEQAIIDAEAAAAQAAADDLAQLEADCLAGVNCQLTDCPDLPFRCGHCPQSEIDEFGHCIE